MSLALTYLDDLSRVRIQGTDITGSTCEVQRSTDRIRWATVRGGGEVTLVDRAFTLDDYEFNAGVVNYYRAVPNRDPIDLGFSFDQTSAGAGVSVDVDHDGTFGFNLANRAIRLTLTIDDVTKVSDLSLFAGFGSPHVTNNIRWRFFARNSTDAIGKSGEQFQIDLKLAEVNTSGGTVSIAADGEVPTNPGYIDLRFRFSDNSTGPVRVQLHKAELVPIAAAGGYVSITFDDGQETVYTNAKPKMDALGFRGTHYTIVERVGDVGRVTMANLQEMADDGWEIAGHAYATAAHDARYTGLTRAAAEDDLADLRGWLGDNFPREGGRYSFAYPGGQFGNTTDGAAVESLVRRAGFASGRTILASAQLSTHLQIAGIPDPMPYRLHGASGISELQTGQSNPDNLIATGGMLDKVASNGCAWLILAFHQIVTTTPIATTQIAKSDFDAIMDAIEAKGLTVLPVAEALDRHESAITPQIEDFWIKSPTRPFLNRRVEISNYSPIARRSRAGVFDIVGRSYPVAVTDLRSSRSFEVGVRTLTLDEAEELDFLLASGEPIFFQVPPECPLPGEHPPTIYAAVGDTAMSRVGLDGGRLFSLPLTEIAAPHWSIAGVTMTWQGVMNAFATWADVMAAEESWATLQDLIGDPEDVIVP